MAQDGHSNQSRDHIAKRMLAVNGRGKPRAFHLEDDWMEYHKADNDPESWPEGNINLYPTKLVRGKAFRAAFEKAGRPSLDAGNQKKKVLPSECTQIDFRKGLVAEYENMPEGELEGILKSFSENPDVYARPKKKRFYYRSVAQSKQYVHVIYAWTLSGSIASGSKAISHRGPDNDPSRYCFIFVAPIFQTVLEEVETAGPHQYFGPEHEELVRRTTIHEVGHQFALTDDTHKRTGTGDKLASPEEIDAIDNNDIGKLWWWRTTGATNPTHVSQFRKCVMVGSLKENRARGSNHFCPIDRMRIRNYDWRNPNQTVNDGIPAEAGTLQ